MKKKKILFIVPEGDQGGAERQTLYLLKNLNRDKYEVYLGLLYPLLKLKEEFDDLDLPQVNFAKKGKFDFGVFFRIARFIRKNKVEIVQSFQGNHHAYLGAFLGGGIKCIGGIRDTHYDILSAQQKFFKFVLGKWIVNSKRMLLISNSFEGKKLFVRKGVHATKIKVIPNGIDKAYKPGTKSKGLIKPLGIKSEVIIGTVSRIAKKKRVMKIVKAFEILRKKSRVKLLIVGGGPLLPSIEAYITTTGLADDVLCTGSRTDVAALLNCMDIFVFSAVQEGWPNVIGEAMACSLPVVSRKSGDVPFIIEDGVDGILVDNDTEFTDEILKLVKHKKAREKLGIKARKKIVNNFSIDRMVAAYEQVYEEL